MKIFLEYFFYYQIAFSLLLAEILEPLNLNSFMFYALLAIANIFLLLLTWGIIKWKK